MNEENTYQGYNNKIKYKGKLYYIEFFKFNYPIKSMLIILGDLKICAISKELIKKDKSKELHRLIKGKKLQKVSIIA